MFCMSIRPGWHEEHGGPRRQQLGSGARIERGIERAFGDGTVSRGLNEDGKGGIGDGMCVHPEAAHRHRMDRRLLGIGLISSHPEPATLDPSHVIARMGARNLGVCTG
jgi:hypothetical protein